MTTARADVIDVPAVLRRFELPPALEAAAPPRSRDDVRLLVAGPAGILHQRFPDLPRFLEPGDLVVINTSATVSAAVDGRRADGRPVVVHFASDLGSSGWAVEIRPRRNATGPLPDVASGELITLAGGVELVVGAPYPAGQPRPRLWQSLIAVEGGVLAYLARFGRPIRYSYVPRRYPLSDYQTVFAREPGSAEMPSAGRPFTAEIVVDLAARGVTIAPITLHTGVSSQDAGEPPLPERYRVPAATARLVSSTRRAGRRVVAVGTTVTRALESAADEHGDVQPSRGWTELVLGPDRPARVVTGLITGWHAPGASHLQLLQAVAGADLVDAAYAAALQERYRWHEFGDSCLLLPPLPGFGGIDERDEAEPPKPAGHR
jgi:S-adenosylmethionine:tRNA ribosyltransferase-isomerase